MQQLNLANSKRLCNATDNLICGNVLVQSYIYSTKISFHEKEGKVIIVRVFLFEVGGHVK